MALGYCKIVHRRTLVVDNLIALIDGVWLLFTRRGVLAKQKRAQKKGLSWNSPWYYVGGIEANRSSCERDRASWRARPRRDDHRPLAF